MSTVIERCEALSSRMQHLQQLEMLQGEAAKVQERRSEIEARRRRLALGLAQASVLVEQGHLDATVWPDVTKTRAALARVREKLQTDPAKITSGRDYKQLLDQVDRAAQALKKAVEDAWESVCKDADPVNKRLLQRLSQVPGQELTVERVRTFQQQLRASCASPPETLDDYTAFRTAADRLVEAWQALDHGDLPDAVVRFFGEAQKPNGASESLWTDEVRDWLHEHDMLGGVRIHFKGER